MKKIKDLFVKYKEVISYLFFGGLTTIVSWGSYALFAKLCGFSINISNILSWVCAVAFAYVTNKLFVFNSKEKSTIGLLKEVGLFLSARILSGLFEIISVPLLVWIGLNQTIFGIEGMVSKVIVSVGVVILNYILSKLIVFKKKK